MSETKPKVKCPECGKEYTVRGLPTHTRRMHPEVNYDVGEIHDAAVVIPKKEARPFPTSGVRKGWDRGKEQIKPKSIMPAPKTPKENNFKSLDKYTDDQMKYKKASKLRFPKSWLNYFRRK